MAILHTLTCQQCGETFKNNRQEAKFCSPACFGAARTASARARGAAQYKDAGRRQRDPNIIRVCRVCERVLPARLSTICESLTCQWLVKKAKSHMYSAKYHVQRNVDDKEMTDELAREIMEATTEIKSIDPADKTHSFTLDMPGAWMLVEKIDAVPDRHHPRAHTHRYILTITLLDGSAHKTLVESDLFLLDEGWAYKFMILKVKNLLDRTAAQAALAATEELCPDIIRTW